MYLVDVIPLGRMIPKDSLSYLSRAPKKFGDFVVVPLGASEVCAFVVGSRDIREVKQDIKQMSLKLKFLKETENRERKNVLSHTLIELIPRLAQFYQISQTQVLARVTPPSLFRDNFYPEKVGWSEKKEKKLIQPKNWKRSLENFIQNLQKQSQNRSIHIIAPTQIEVEDLKERIALCCGKGSVEFLHGGMQKAKRKKVIECIFQSGTPYLVTTPLFFDFPLPGRSEIILTHASSPYYRDTREPFIDFRSTIEAYAYLAQIPLRVLNGFPIDPFLPHWREEKLIVREGEQEETLPLFPQTVLVPYRKRQEEREEDQERLAKILRERERRGEHDFIFQTELFERLKSSVNDGKTLFLYTQRKHFASQLVCADCGTPLTNPRTGAKLILTGDGKTFSFLDPTTGEEVPPYDSCPVCGSWRITPLGIGSERVAHFIETNFPEATILLIDGNHLKKHKILEGTLDKLSNRGGAKVIVGTRRAIPYLRGKSVDEVYIVSTDTLLALPSPAAEKEVYDLLAELERIAPRVFFQTRLYRGERRVIQKQEEGSSEESGIAKLIQQRIQKLVQSQEESARRELYTEDLPLWRGIERKVEAYVSSESTILLRWNCKTENLCNEIWDILKQLRHTTKVSLFKTGRRVYLGLSKHDWNPLSVNREIVPTLQLTRTKGNLLVLELFRVRMDT